MSFFDLLGLETASEAKKRNDEIKKLIGQIMATLEERFGAIEKNLDEGVNRDPFGTRKASQPAWQYQPRSGSHPATVGNQG